MRILAEECQHPRGARRHAGHLDPRADVRSRGREAGAEHPPGHWAAPNRWTRCCGPWGVEPAGPADTIAAGLRAEPALRRTHLGRRALLGDASTAAAQSGVTAKPGKADHAAGRFQRLEDSWAEHTAYIETRTRLVSPLERRQLEALAQAVDDPRPARVVYNPLPWNAVRAGRRR